MSIKRSHKTSLSMLGGVIAAAVLARMVLRRSRRISLRGKIV